MQLSGCEAERGELKRLLNQPADLMNELVLLNLLSELHAGGELQDALAQLVVVRLPASSEEPAGFAPRGLPVEPQAYRDGESAP